VVEKVTSPNLSADEQRKVQAKLDYAARGLLPLWQMAIQLCEADFWREFTRYLKIDKDGRIVTDAVPPDWWDKIDRGDRFTLLVDAGYLKKDDWTGWQDKFAQDLVAGKVDPAVVKDRLKRLTDVIDSLVGRRMGRAPKAADHPAEAFFEYVQSGLLEKALQMVEKKDNGPEVDVRASYGDALRLMVWLGSAENAKKLLDGIPEGKTKSHRQEVENDPKFSADARALELSKFRMIDFELAKLDGDYKKADTVFTELLTTPMGPRPPFLEAARLGKQLPPPTMTDLIFPDLWRPGDFPPLTDTELVELPRLLDLVLPPLAEELVLTGGVTASWASTWTNQEREHLRLRLLYQALTHYQRGVYALLGGDPARAREQFDKAADPQGIKRHQKAVPTDAPKEAQEALPVNRLGPAPQMRGAFGELLKKYQELLSKYDAK